MKDCIKEDDKKIVAKLKNRRKRPIESRLFRYEYELNGEPYEIGGEKVADVILNNGKIVTVNFDDNKYFNFETVDISTTTNSNEYANHYVSGEIERMREAYHNYFTDWALTYQNGNMTQGTTQIQSNDDVSSSPGFNPYYYNGTHRRRLHRHTLCSTDRNNRTVPFNAATISGTESSRREIPHTRITGTIPNHDANNMTHSNGMSLGTMLERMQADCDEVDAQIRELTENQ